jgi:Terminase small subunit
VALTPKMKAWLEHYLAPASPARWNATEAARLAGYKDPEQSGWENKQKLEIQTAIAQRLDHLKAGADEILVRMAGQARSSIADALRLPDPLAPAGSRAASSWDIDLIKAQQTGAIDYIKKIKAGKYGTEIEMYDAHEARVKLGEHHQLWGKAVDLLKYVDLTRLSPEQLKRIADGEDPLAVLLASPVDPAPRAGDA